MAKIKITRTTFVAGDLAVEGKVVDVDTAVARQLVRAGKAEFVEAAKRSAGKGRKSGAGGNAGKGDGETEAGGNAGGSQE